ncbi:MAG: nitrophenyl compound nitroreductase subunit ArsF family protein [Nanoarchaeota archaeon]
MTKQASQVEKVEIIHFHGMNQCPSCIAVGKLAEETVNSYYTQEVKSGKVTFAHINAELPENKELAAKYGVTGSSLWIGVYGKDGFSKEENVNVWYKISDREAYLTYLKGVIDKRLVGDMS